MRNERSLERIYTRIVDFTDSINNKANTSCYIRVAETDIVRARISSGDSCVIDPSRGVLMIAYYNHNSTTYIRKLFYLDELDHILNMVAEFDKEFEFVKQSLYKMNNHKWEIDKK